MDAHAQPIPTSATSPKAGPSVDANEQKPRYTKTERRQFAKEKKAAAKAAQPAQPVKGDSRKKKAPFHDLSSLGVKEIDAMLVRLLELKQLKERQGDRALANRITRDGPKEKREKKKELSPEKLEKMQKRREQRRELRAEKRQTLLAKRAGGVEGADVVPAASAPALVIAASQQAPFAEDEINFDEL